MECSKRIFSCFCNEYEIKIFENNAKLSNNDMKIQKVKSKYYNKLSVKTIFKFQLEIRKHSEFY